MGSDAVVIGAGFAGLSAASFLAKDGYSVTVLEKNSTPGGRAQTFSAEGFTFDMGPSWYWMPDVFERYFAHFGHPVADLYTLRRLDPSYTIWSGKGDTMHVPASPDRLLELFEQIEPGSSAGLRKFLAEAAYKYDVGMSSLVNLPGRSLLELLDLNLLRNLTRLDIFSSMSAHVRRYFSHPRLIRMLEFPVLFLGATARHTPALYSLMNHADLTLGTWYPMGGMGRVTDAMVYVAKNLGVRILCNQSAEHIEVRDHRAVAVHTANGTYSADVVVGAADYHHVEQHLLRPDHRRYSQRYWESRSMAPSALMFYLGLNIKVPSLSHHNIFLHTDPDLHAHQIYAAPCWPTAPQFYVSVTSRTETTVAPIGCENLVILIPVAPGLGDTEAVREHYLHLVLNQLGQMLGTNLRQHVVYQRSYAHSDFIAQYNAFKGNAYGLANTLWQTANLKPRIDSAKVRNLYYAGQLTVPGPGVPPALISGEVVAREAARDHRAGRW